MEKEFEKEVSKLETRELMEIYQKTQLFINYLEKEEKDKE